MEIYSFVYPKIFTILALTLRSLIHLELIFCVWCEVEVQIYSFACDYSVVSVLFAEKSILWIVLMLCQKSIVFLLFLFFIYWETDMMETVFLKICWGVKVGRFIYLSNLSTQRGAWTPNLEIKSCLLYWLSQPGALPCASWNKEQERLRD